ncbi:hypothetical protein AAFC00_006461 [Neodothiora populina]|uniref:Zn(2)-C6 fungal-type domain-containing protein n=1 Tax=Neodothiora populina TaxID=2781224 RepID=A0ABR3P5L7_9PEZI
MASTHGVYGESVQTSRSSQSPALLPESSSSALRDRKKKQQQPRQLLSCTKCRERKVKCDRTKPCSACCARGSPKECHFVLGEGTEFGPIQQSLELRKLRAENQRLKERLLAAKVSLSDDSEDDDGSSTGKPGHSNRRGTNRQKRFRTGDHTDSLYFGSPGLANVISDVEPKSLAFTIPRGADVYAGHNSMYPFPALWQATLATKGLLNLLEPREALLTYVDTFVNKAVGLMIPVLPEELTRKEVEKFLDDADQNALRYPDALALILAGSALGVQLGGDSKSTDGVQKGDIFIAAAMQALRASAFMSRPTLRSLHTILIIGPYLTNSGRFLDAWSLFGLAIRLAQAIGLHRHPKYLDPVPELRECTIRSNVWWWMLHTDQLYSMTLGRPLGISGIGDCQPAEPLTTNPAVLRLGEFVDQLTLLGRQILSSNQLTDPKIDLFTDRLISLWDTMPDMLQFNNNWSAPDYQLPEYPLCANAAIHYCKIHSYIVLLNRQRIENVRASPEYNSPSPRSYQASADDHILSGQPVFGLQAVSRGRPMVLQSSLALLDAFIYFYRRVRIALTDWTIGQQAFNACMLLLLDALETAETYTIPKVEQAYTIFVELDKGRLHQIAEIAVSRISEGLLRLRNLIEKGRITPEGIGQKSAVSDQKTSRKDIVSRNSDELTNSLYFDESVMESRGMFLLEDPGLQGRSVVTPATTPNSGIPIRLSQSTPSTNHPEFKPPMKRTLSTQLQRQQNYVQQLYYRSEPQQSVIHQSVPPTPIAYNYPPGQGPNYTLGFESGLLPRRDSATAGSGQLANRMMESTSPHQAYQLETCRRVSAVAAMQPPSGYRMAPGKRPPGPPTQQSSDAEWHTLGPQHAAHSHGTQKRQLFPPYQPSSRS